MDRRYKWVNELIRLGHIKCENITTGEQRADGLTKLMTGKEFTKSRNFLLGIESVGLTTSGGGDKDEWSLGRSPAEANPSKQNKFVELKRLEHLEI